MACEACGKPLNRSQRRRGNALKSCPNCSTRDGRQHVYHDYPDAFGETAARATASDPDGPQSWCTRCRADADDAWPGTLCADAG